MSKKLPTLGKLANTFDTYIEQVDKTRQAQINYFKNAKNGFKVNYLLQSKLEEEKLDLMTKQLKDYFFDNFEIYAKQPEGSR